MYRLNSTSWRRCATASLAVIVGCFGAALFVARPVSASTLATYQLTRFAGVAGSAGTAANQKFNNTYSIAVNTAGDVFAADEGNSTVDEVTPSGNISLVAGGGGTVPSVGTTISATAAQFLLPTSVAVDSSGNLYITDWGHDEVDKVTPSGQLSVIAGGGSTHPTAGNTYAATSVSMAPDGVAVDSAGNVYIAGWVNDNHVYKVTPAGQLSIIAGTGAATASANGPATSEPLNGANGIAIDSAGDLFVSEQAGGIVVKITPAGQLTVVAGIAGSQATPTNGAATSSHLDGPWGVGVDGAGDLYIADANDGDISAVTPDGQLTVIAGDGTSAAPTYGVAGTSTPLWDPLGVATTSAGRIYISDANNHTLDLLTPGLSVNTALPTISGTVAVGQTLTASTGSWTNHPILYGYQWQACDSSGANCTNIAGATAATYTLTTADEGSTLRVVLTVQNGAGSASADSAVTAVVPVPASVTTITLGPGSAAPLSGVSEGLSITVGAHSAALGYAFQYGTSTAYGQVTAQTSLPASSAQQTVQATLSGLIPGITYHFRLVLSGSAGVAFGPDQTFTTAKVAPVRVLTHIHQIWEASAPYQYRIKGHLRLIRGLSPKVGFQSRGKVVITVSRAGHRIAQRTVRVSRRGTYRTSFTFSQAQLPDTGKLIFRIRFLGNRQLLARKGRTQHRFYGPDYQLLHQLYGFTPTKLP